MANTTNLVGAYTPYTSKISNEDQKAFDEAFKNFTGVRYSPVAVSKQLVAGTNYKFFCNTETVTLYPVDGIAIVSIYKPLDGEAHIIGIQNIN